MTMSKTNTAVIKNNGLDVWFYSDGKLLYSVIYQTSELADTKAKEWVSKDD